MDTAAHYLIAFASRWGTVLGGINSFNTDLLNALRVAVDGNKMKVLCVVLFATQEEIKQAEKNCITLLSLDKAKVTTFTGSSDLQAEINDLLKPYLEKATEVVWLGHDRITGHVANAMVTTYAGSRSAVIHHMSYDHYESYVESSQEAEGKLKEQKEIFTNANIKLAIGPLLQEALMDMLDKTAAEITCLIPGLLEIEPRKNPLNRFLVFMSGRVAESTHKLKQPHLAIAALANAIHQADQNSLYPDQLKSEHQPYMILRGVELEDRVENAGSTEKELKLFAEKIAQCVVDIKTLPFTTDKSELMAELIKASVAVMLSWHEGFGLVAWEAIAASIPLIITKKSGVYKLLVSLQNGLYKDYVIAANVQGSNEEPYYTEQDLNEVTDSIFAIAQNYDLYKRKALTLREELIKTYTWKRCAEDLVTALAWQADLISSNLTVSPQLKDTPLDSSTDNQTSRFITLPKPMQYNPGLNSIILLRAENEIIPFDITRKELLLEQLEWAKDVTYPITVKLITGKGGAGKTRLALQLCKELIKEHWSAGFLTNDMSIKNVGKLIHEMKADNRPYCIVVDYAETRCDLLKVLFEALISCEKPNVRVLLLARDSGEWWDSLSKKSHLLETLLISFATTEAKTISNMYDENQKEQAFRTAIKHFADKLNIILPQHYYIPELDESYFSEPLYIQMAALLSLQGEQSKSSEQLTRALISHEQRYWRQLINNPSLDKAADLLMLLVTLAGGVKIVKDIEPIWLSANCGDKSALKITFNLLKTLYPNEQGLDNLKPDLLGEAYVEEALVSDKLENNELVVALLNSSSSIKHHTLTVLARLMKTKPAISDYLTNILKKCLINCIAEYLTVCVETPSNQFSELFSQVFKHLTAAQQSQLAGIVVNKIDVDILPFTSIAVTVYQAKADKLANKLANKPNEIDKFDYSKILVLLSIALRNDGQFNAALIQAKKAQQIIEALYQSQPERYADDYAVALNNYANYLSQEGKNTEALARAEQAVQITEELYLSQPERYANDYAGALNNYANYLSEEGKNTEALARAEQAVQIREELYLSKPERYVNDYARALNNYANYLSEEGKNTEALARAEQAVQITEELYLSKPERYADDYAGALNNYANRLSQEGKSTEALARAERAVQIREELYLSKPERYVNDYARALNNYANYLSEEGKNTEALARAEQAVQIREELYLSKPERYANDYARALNNYANYLSQDGKNTEALATAEQAVQITEKLYLSQPERYANDYTRVLDTYAECFYLQKKINDALKYNKIAQSVCDQSSTLGKKLFEEILANHHKYLESD